MKAEKVTALLVAFMSGDRRAMAAQRCPQCGSPFVWMPLILPEARERDGRSVRHLALSVSCRGAISHRYGHWDGIAPDWSLSISDWDRFNRELEQAKA